MKTKDKQPASTVRDGDVRLVWEGNRWVIEEYGDECLFGVGFDWWEQATARTLWGIKRQWRKLYGTSRPFPDINIVAWQSK